MRKDYGSISDGEILGHSPSSSMAVVGFSSSSDAGDEELEVCKKKFYCGSQFRQYYSTIATNISVMTVGNMLAWPATAVPDINENDSAFPNLDTSKVGWITSVALLGGTAVCPMMGYVMQWLGLRRSMVVLALPLFLGYVLTALSNSFWMLLLGRFITGFCSGGSSLATPVFVAEIADAEIRGLLGYSFDIMCSIGQLYVYFIGAYVSWRWQSVACGVIPIFFYVSMLAVPDSPRDLILNGKYEEAKKALAWFRHADSLDLVEEEFNSILKELSSTKTALTGREYFSPSIRKPTIICMVLASFYAACGSSFIISYTVQMFKSSNVTHTFLATNLTGLTQVIMACLAALFVDRAGRRILLILSGIGMSLCFIVLGAYLHWEAKFGASWDSLPVVLVILFIVLFSCGFGPIPWVIMGEVVPPAAKGYTSCMILCSYRITAFVILLVYNDLVKDIGQDFVFFLFSTVCLIGSLYVFLRVPETKQKTLAEIQLLFSQ